MGYVHGEGNSKALSLHNDEQRGPLPVAHGDPMQWEKGARRRVSMTQKDGVRAPAPALRCTHVRFVLWNLGAPWITAVCSPPSDFLFLNRKSNAGIILRSSDRRSLRDGKPGAGEMAHRLRGRVAVPNGPGFNSHHLHVSSQLTPLPRDQMPFSSLCRHCAHSHVFRENIHIHKNKTINRAYSLQVTDWTSGLETFACFLVHWQSGWRRRHTPCHRPAKFSQWRIIKC